MSTEAMRVALAEPLPCPFCGSTEGSDEQGGTYRWRLWRCGECGACGPETRCNIRGSGNGGVKEAHKLALDEWNTRAAPPAALAQRADEPVARWYSVSRNGLATLCSGKRDAIETAASQDVDWKASSPHRAVQLIDAAAARVRDTYVLKLEHDIEQLRAAFSAQADAHAVEIERFRNDRQELLWLREELHVERDKALLAVSAERKLGKRVADQLRAEIEALRGEGK